MDENLINYMLMRAAYEKEKTIKHNKAKCLICGDIVESKHRHDFVTCTCGNLSVDGGTDYCKRNAKDVDMYEELSEYV